MSKGAQSEAILDAWHAFLDRKYELEAELDEIENAVDALRPIVEGGTPNGPCAGLSARDAALVVLKEMPGTIWTNTAVLDRMMDLGWEPTAKTSGGVSGMITAALKQLSKQGLVTKLARGQWQVAPHHASVATRTADPASAISREAMGLPPRSPVDDAPEDDED